MTTSIVNAVVTAALGPPGRQRVRASQSLLALVVYVMFSGLQHAEVLLGLIDPVESAWLTGTYLTGSALFYVVIRSGLNERHTADPSLTLPQTAFGLTIAAGSYAITGPARGAVLTLMVLILAFTSFSLRPTQSRALAAYALGLLGAVMWWKSRTAPLRYAPAIEAVQFVFALIVVGGVTVLAGRMGAMRARLRSQKQALEQALERIGQLATRDELTGLVNRRHMTELLNAAQARQRRDASALTVALLDIDLFKRINDTHGHQAGDTVLKGFAEACLRCLRLGDVLARWGGEEFLLMLPGTSTEHALVVIERLREAVGHASFDVVEPGLAVTFSAGLSACLPGSTLESTLEHADQAMYMAKKQGRNRSVLA